MLQSFVYLVGLATIAIALRRFASFLHIYFVHSTTIQRYITDDDTSYALVTGASDGLGKAMAEDLYDRGFNLVIHGRNEEKLRKVQESLLSRTTPQRDVKCFIADATAPPSSWDFSPLTELNVTTCFLSAGGSGSDHKPFDEQTGDHDEALLRLNATFSLRVVKALLPRIRSSRLPSLIVAIGTAGSIYTPPFLSIYGSSKAMLAQWIHAMAVEQRHLDPTADITFHSMISGEFVSSVNVCDASWMCPLPGKMAKAVIAAVGCGHREVIPYIGHVPGLAFLALIGEKWADRLVAYHWKTNYLEKSN